MNAPAGIDVNDSAHGITVRDRRFGRGAVQERWWAGGDPIATAWFNALSATFPRGETLFVDAVKAFRADAPPQLAAEIRAFVKQEVNHTREHARRRGSSGTSSAGPASCAACSRPGALTSCPASIRGTRTTAR